MQNPAPPPLPPEAIIITRAEYEARHSALQALISQNEARLINEQNLLKADVERKFDRLLDGFENLRKELVARDLLEPQLAALREQIKEIKQAQVSRQELFALRIAALAGLGGLIFAMLQYFIHFRFTP